jgi:hypothetical protein
MAASPRTSTARRRKTGAIGILVFFTWWIGLQQRVEGWPSQRRWTLIGVAAIVGVTARLWAQTLPGNWDFGQWINVSTATLEGQDP